MKLMDNMWEELYNKFHKPDESLKRGLVTAVTLLILAAVLLVTGLLIGSMVLNLIAVMLAAATGASMRGWQRHVQQVAIKEKAPALTRWPWRAGRYIVPLKQPALWEGRMHPIMVFKWWLLATGSFVAGVVIGATTGNALVFLGVWLVPSAIAGWNILEWFMCWMIITDDYVILITGIIVWHGPAIRIAKLEYVDPIDTPLGRMLHYRHLHFDTASQNDPFNDLLGVRTPLDTPEEETPYGLLLRYGARSAKQE